MKRTKENWNTSQPQDRLGISGCKVFDGEDLLYWDRKKEQAEKIKEWVEQQKAEKNERFMQDQDEEREYADQTTQVNRMRGMLEDKLESQKRMMQESLRDANQKLALERKLKEKREKEQKLQEEKAELEEQERVRQVTHNPHDYTWWGGK